MHPSLQHHGSSSTMFSIRADRTRRAYSRCGKQCATKACVEVSPRISPCERSTDVAVSATSAIHVGGRATNAWVTEVRNATAPTLRKTGDYPGPTEAFRNKIAHLGDEASTDVKDSPNKLSIVNTRKILGKSISANSTRLWAGSTPL
jgi:hypothetical protein